MRGVLLLAVLAGCAAPPRQACLLHLSQPQGYRLVESLRNLDSLVGPLKDGRWATVFRQAVQVEKGDLLDVRATSQGTTEDRRARYQLQLLVDGQLLGGSSCQSIAQPDPHGGNHHTPMAALGVWQAPAAGAATVEVQMLCSIEERETRVNQVDQSSRQPFGSLCVAHYQKGPKGLGLTRCLTAFETPSGKPPWRCCKKPDLFEPLFHEMVPTDRGDTLYAFGSLTSRWATEAEAGSYPRPHQDYDGEQIGSVFSLDGQAISANHGENVQSEHPLLQAYNDILWGPCSAGNHSLAFHLGGAYSRGAWAEDWGGLALVYGAGGRSLCEVEEIRLGAGDFHQGRYHHPVQLAPGDGLHVSLLLNLHGGELSREERVELKLGQSCQRVRRTLGGLYRDGFVRLELATESAPAEGLEVTATLPQVDGYLQIQRFSCVK